MFKPKGRRTRTSSQKQSHQPAQTSLIIEGTLFFRALMLAPPSFTSSSLPQRRSRASLIASTSASKIARKIGDAADATLRPSSRFTRACTKSPDRSAAGSSIVATAVADGVAVLLAAPAAVCVCVCVCACDTEREREREGEKKSKRRIRRQAVDS